MVLLHFLRVLFHVCIRVLPFIDFFRAFWASCRVLVVSPQSLFARATFLKKDDSDTVYHHTGFSGPSLSCETDHHCLGMSIMSCLCLSDFSIFSSDNVRSVRARVCWFLFIFMLVFVTPTPNHHSESDVWVRLGVRDRVGWKWGGLGVGWWEN